MLITPKFWYKNTFVSYILLPLSFVFVILSKLRAAWQKPFTIPDKFVICVGNATIGGTGKTPTVIAIAEAIKPNHSVCILTKGYGRKTKGFFKIEERHTSEETGDEPQILQKSTTVYLYSNINDIKKNYRKINENVIIMDDGMQNSIVKNFVVMIIGRRGFGNGMIFPAGPLREKIIDALKKASAILYTSSFRTDKITEVKTYGIQQKFYTNANTQERYIAFSGLGDNQKFLLSLKAQGFNILHFFEFKDHHLYTAQDMEKITNIAKELQCKIVTTEKDFVKIPSDMQTGISVLHVEYKLEQKFVQDIQDMIQASL